MSLNSLVNNSLCIGTSNRSLGQGNVFTSVCQSFCSQGYACMPPGTYAPLGMHDSPPPVTQAPMPPGHARPPGMHTPPGTVNAWAVHILLECILVMYYRPGTVNSNTVNSNFHLIRSYCEIFFYHVPTISCLKCTVNSNFHLIRSKTLLTNDFELTIPDL